MARPIPEELIDQVRNHFDILDVVAEYVQLKKSGRYYFGLCPFHSEKTPSFSVSPDKQIFHCFGCGAGGDVISFIRKIEGLEFLEAVKFLADKAGIPWPLDEEKSAGSAEAEEKNLMLRAHELVAKLYQHILWKTEYGRIGLEYYQKRGFSPATIKEFSLGYAPDAWDLAANFLRRRRFPPELMVKAGLLVHKETGDGKEDRFFDRFRGRAIFPIWDSQGRVVAFGGRVLGDGQPKYLNSPETPLFNKSFHLYNLHRARPEIRKKQQAVLMEGYVDVITAWQAGIRNAVATLGTALTERQARILRRNAEQVVICYDSDAAGQEAAVKAGDLLAAAGCSVKVALMPKGLDPDEYIRRYGGEHFAKNILLQAVTLTAFKLQHLRISYELQDEADRMRYIQAALTVISRLRNAVERDHYLRRLAEEFHLSLDALKEEQRHIFRKLKKKEAKRDNLENKWNNSINNGKRLVANPVHPAYYNAERYLVALMMRNREIAEQIREKIGGAFNVDEFAALSAYLYAYYAEGNAPDPGKFMQRLRDDRLIETASELAVAEINENVTEKEIADYIKKVLNYPKWLEIERLKEEMKRQERIENHMEAARLGMEIFRLQKELKEA
ncbi:DNA primase [Bacillaceae bacterium]